MLLTSRLRRCDRAPVNQLTSTSRRTSLRLNQGVFDRLHERLRPWLDPSTGGVGSTPDYRFSLANERTFLAWIRTGLALVGGGLAVAAFVPPLRWPYVRETVAIVLMAFGAIIALRAVDHWARSERAMRLGEPLPRSAFPALLSIAVAVGATGLVVVLVLNGIS